MNLSDKFSKLHLEFLGSALYLIMKMLRTISSSGENNVSLWHELMKRHTPKRFPAFYMTSISLIIIKGLWDAHKNLYKAANTISLVGCPWCPWTRHWKYELRNLNLQLKENLTWMDLCVRWRKFLSSQAIGLSLLKILCRILSCNDLSFYHENKPRKKY